LDNLNQPMVWINRWTIFVGIVFIAHIVMLMIYKHRNGKNVRNEYRRDEQYA
jgi:preprotein translocase subunit SecG